MKKGELKLFIDKYKETGDPIQAAMVAFSIDNYQIAEIRATELLNKRHIFDKVKKSIVDGITDEKIKVEFWLLLKKSKDERNKIRILENLAEYIGMKEKQVTNIYSGNFTWQQLVSAAHAEKQRNDTILKEGQDNGVQIQEVKEIKEVLIEPIQEDINGKLKESETIPES